MKDKTEKGDMGATLEVVSALVKQFKKVAADSADKETALLNGLSLFLQLYSGKTLDDVTVDPSRPEGMGDDAIKLTHAALNLIRSIGMKHVTEVLDKVATRKGVIDTSNN